MGRIHSVLTLSWLWLSLLSTVCNGKRKKSSGGSEVTIMHGPTLKFTDPKAKGTLSTWALELNKHGGSVTHYQAVNREQEVVRNVESGLWDISAYHEYQRMASVSGNVDSARLLVQYGIEQTIKETCAQKTYLGRLCATISHCDVKAFQAMISSNDDFYANMGAEDGTSLLMMSAYFNCDSILNHLLDVEAEVDVVGMHGLSAFLVAASVGHVEPVRLLVTKGEANVNTPHKFGGNSALHMAAELDQADMVRVLCALGIDADRRTTSGSNALHVAATSNASLATVHNLVNACHIDVNALLNNDTTPLYLAAQHGHARTVSALLQAGADVHFSMPLAKYEGEKHLMGQEQRSGDLDGMLRVINSQAGNGAEALHAAAENGHAAVVRLLVTQGGARVDSLSMGVTALHLAAQYNRLEAARALVDLGADLDLPSNTDYSTPLFHAVRHNFLEMIRLLSSQGASVNFATPSQRFTPLLAAIRYGHLTAVELLLKLGADPFAVTVDGFNALHFAVLNGDPRLVSLLVAYVTRGPGAESSAHSCEWSDAGGSSDGRSLSALLGAHSLPDGATPLHYAASNGLLEIASQLLALGASSRVPMKEAAGAAESSLNFGASPLYVAASRGDLSMAYLLLRSGADPDQALNAPSSLTPLLTAIDKDLVDVVSLLLTGRFKGSAEVDARMSSSARTFQFVCAAAGGTSKGAGKGVPTADPNRGVAGSSGVMQSPILLAVRRGRAAIVRALLEAGAHCNLMVVTRKEALSDPRLQDTLVDLARRARDFDTTQALLAYERCDPDAIRANA